MGSNPCVEPTSMSYRSIKARAAELAVKNGCAILDKGKEVQGALVDEYMQKLRVMLISLESLWSKAQSMLRFRRLVGEWLQHEKRIKDAEHAHACTHKDVVACKL